MILYQVAKRLQSSREAGARLEMPSGGMAEMEKWLLELVSSGNPAGNEAAETTETGTDSLP